ncbi:MAG: alpha/beta fold hydrolase [Microthrixaceae bacterium]
MPFRRTAARFVLFATLTACASEAAAPVGTSTTPVPTTTTVPAPSSTTTTTSLPEAQPVEWTACGGGFQCGSVRVPIDYADLTLGTLDLAVVRHPATDPARRIGSLLVNPGGPGASGVRRVRRGFTITPEVAARFDIIGFDPRGVGASAPIRCGATVSAFRAEDLAPDSPEEEQRLAGAARAVADECLATEGDRLGHLGTREGALDVEMIRRSLGEEQVSFVGLSYGTLLGLRWAEAFPESVRALVLDSVVDPQSTSVSSSVNQVESIDEVVAAMDADCAARAACPVRSVGGVGAAYDELARRLDGDLGTTGVGPTQLAYAVFSATYGSSRWPELYRALRSGLDGDLSGVATMARWFTALVPYTSFAIVSCLDSPHPSGFDAWQRDADDLARRSPRFGRIAANELLPCAFWPKATSVPHRITAAGAPPALVVGSTGDVATPYDQAVRVARALASAALLTVEIDGHIALGASACADAAIARYLVDLVPPADGARC